MVAPLIASSLMVPCVVIYTLPSAATAMVPSSTSLILLIFRPTAASVVPRLSTPSKVMLFALILILSGSDKAVISLLLSPSNTFRVTSPLAEKTVSTIKSPALLILMSSAARAINPYFSVSTVSEVVSSSTAESCGCA